MQETFLIAVKSLMIDIKVQTEDIDKIFLAHSLLLLLFS